MKKGLVYALLVFTAGIVSTLLHELGHCLFYWFQGVPAAMSLAKEYPLRDITAAEYAIGSAGGPLINLILLGMAAWLYRKYKENPKLRRLFSALMLANVFYFLLRGIISLLKRRGGELGDIAGLLGLDYRAVVAAFGVICAAALIFWLKVSKERLSFRKALAFLALLIGTVFVMAGLEAIDKSLFWNKFPTIQIDDGRTYHDIWGRTMKSH